MIKFQKNADFYFLAYIVCFISHLLYFLRTLLLKNDYQSAANNMLLNFIEMLYLADISLEVNLNAANTVQYLLKLIDYFF